MKKLFLAVAAIFVSASASSADPLIPALNCPDNSCFALAPLQTTFLGVPLRFDASLDGPLAQAITLLASVPPPQALAAISAPEFVPASNDSFVANPLDPELSPVLPSRVIGAAEPPTLLLLATGLLCASLYRKHARHAQKSSPPLCLAPSFGSQAPPVSPCTPRSSRAATVASPRVRRRASPVPIIFV